MAKYKINDYVKVSFQPEVHVFQIFEITEVTCTAGTQVFYKGRINGVTEKGMLYHGPRETTIREEEITGTSKQEDVWDEAAKLRAERDKAGGK